MYHSECLLRDFGISRPLHPLHKTHTHMQSRRKSCNSLTALPYLNCTVILQANSGFNIHSTGYEFSLSLGHTGKHYHGFIRNKGRSQNKLTHFPQISEVGGSEMKAQIQTCPYRCKSELPCFPSGFSLEMDEILWDMLTF